MLEHQILMLAIRQQSLKGYDLSYPTNNRHSDVFVLIRIGVTRKQFRALFKKISVIKDKNS